MHKCVVIVILGESEKRFAFLSKQEAIVFVLHPDHFLFVHSFRFVYDVCNMYTKSNSLKSRSRSIERLFIVRCCRSTSIKLVCVCVCRYPCFMYIYTTLPRKERNLVYRRHSKHETLIYWKYCYSSINLINILWYLWLFETWKQPLVCSICVAIEHDQWESHKPCKFWRSLYSEYIVSFC